MQCTHQDHHFRSCSACGVRPLPEMCEATYGLLDVEAPAGDERSRIERLCYAYLLGGYVPGDAGLRACKIVFEEVALLYPSECPILCLWRIWWQNKSASLACAAVRRPPPKAGSLSHRAMASWSCLHWRYRGKECPVCVPLYSQIGNAIIPKTGDTHVPPPRHRLDSFKADSG